MSRSRLDTGIYIILMISTLFCILVDALMFRSIQQLTQKEISEERTVWAERLLLQQESYYAQILADTEDASRIRHDIRNQLQTAYSLIAESDTEAAKHQLDGIVSRLERSQTYCSHRVVNSLLSVKGDCFRAAHIKFDCQCEVPQELPIDGVELCSLFSNVLDNPYHASIACNTDNRTIHLVASISLGISISVEIAIHYGYCH